MPSSVRFFSFSILLGSILFFTGCANNPVTGKKELMVVSKQQDIELGKQHFGPSQQSQGGLYVADPKLVAYVNRIGQKIAKLSDSPDLPYEFVIINNSTPNAWALPGGKIAINRGLLVELQDEAQLAAVLSHEIVHAAARHGAKGLQRKVVIGGVLAATQTILEGESSQKAVGRSAEIAGNIVNQQYSQSHEFEADKYGMSYMARAGYDPQAAVELQKIFLKLMEDRQTSWVEGLLASHPPSDKRVAANEETAKNLPKDLNRYPEAYQQFLARLRKMKPAYEAYDEGKKLQATNPRDPKILSLGSQALKLEPKEALFWGLQGEYHLAQKDHEQAIKHFDDAIKRNSNFYHFYLKRAECYILAKEKRKAKRDLRASLALLPTDEAKKLLEKLQ